MRSWKWRWEQGLQVLTTIFLSLFLPLSFLLLARLPFVKCTVKTAGWDSKSGPFTLVLPYGSSIILYALVFGVTVASFFHGLSSNSGGGRSDNGRKSPRYIAWMILGTLIVLSAEIDSTESELNGCVSFSNRRSSRFIIHGQGQIKSLSTLSSANAIVSLSFFVVGLHETTLFWSKSVVKYVVEDSLTGGSLPSSIGEEGEMIRWKIERIGMAMSFGALWWWRLRDQLLLVDYNSLLVVHYFVGWLLLYYLTVSIGAIRALKGVIWVGTKIMLLFVFRTNMVQKELISNSQVSEDDDPAAIEYKV